MGKLNSLIKFGVFNANALLFLGGLGMIVVASVVLAADFIKLAKTYLQTRGIVTVAIGVLVAGMSVIGCVGTHRQIRRDRLWSGRRVLSLYQLLLVTIVVGQGLVQMKLYSVEVSLQEAAEELPDEHGDFESRFREGFNDAYFEQLCAASVGGDDWVWSLIETHCPESISSDMCSCSDILDGVGLPRGCSAERTYVAEDCCPDEEFCAAGLEEACPYAACRTGILEALLNYITPARKYSTFVFVLEGMLLVLTCLLICYNPRDSTEDILIKTGTIMRHQHHPGGDNSNSKPADLEGAAERSAGTNQDIFKLDLVQPAAMARRAAAAGARAGTGSSPGRSTPALSPIAATDAPTEPLRQFMTPRRGGNAVTHTAHSPAENDDYIFEYQNPRKGRSAAVGPPMATASKMVTAAQKSAVRGAGAASDSATASAATAATITTVAAAVGLTEGPASIRRARGGKSSQGEGDGDEEEEKGNFIVAELPPMSTQEEDEEKSGGDFYNQLDAQTPVAEYGADTFETAGGGSAAPRAGAATLRTAGSFDPSVFLTDVSSAQEESPPTFYSHAGGLGSFEGPPSPIVTPPTPLSGNTGENDAGKPRRFGEQTPIMTSPLAANHQDLKITVSATNELGSGTTGAIAASPSGTPQRPPGVSAQTPIPSPTGVAPPAYHEHPAGPDVATTPIDTVDAMDRASSSKLTISNDDTKIGTDLHHHEKEGGAVVSPTPAGFVGRFSMQTPPGGTRAGFDAPAAQEQQERRGSAAYPQSSGGGGITSSLDVDTALTVAEFVPEESAGSQTAALEETTVRELASSPVNGDPTSSSVGKDILTATAAEVAPGGGEGKEGDGGKEGDDKGPVRGDAVAPGSTDAAAPASISSSQPQGRFARFLLKAEESMSKAQMALSLGLESTTTAREEPPADIPPPGHEAASAVPLAEAAPAPKTSAAGSTDGAAVGIVNELAEENEREVSGE